MKIQLHSLMAGPEGIREPGVHDVPDELAAELIDGGFADEHEEHPEADGPEAAVSRKPKEFAQLPRPRVKK